MEYRNIVDSLSQVKEQLSVATKIVHHLYSLINTQEVSRRELESSAKSSYAWIAAKRSVPVHIGRLEEKFPPLPSPEEAKFIKPKKTWKPSKVSLAASPFIECSNRYEVFRQRQMDAKQICYRYPRSALMRTGQDSFRLVEEKFPSLSSPEEAKFKKPQKTWKPSKVSLAASPFIECSNRYEVLRPRQTDAKQICYRYPRSALMSTGQDSVRNQKKRSERSADKSYRKKSSRDGYKKKTEVLLVADSHGREMEPLLQQRLGKRCSTSVRFFPGRKMASVVESAVNFAANFSERDHLIVFGGTNDVGSPESSDFRLDLLKRLRCKVSLVGIPHRHDRPELNSKIKAWNWHLACHCSRNGIGFIDLTDVVSRSSYTRHGLHFNMGGKAKISSLISRHVRQQLSSSRL